VTDMEMLELALRRLSARMTTNDVGWGFRLLADELARMALDRAEPPQPELALEPVGPNGRPVTWHELNGLTESRG